MWNVLTLTLNGVSLTFQTPTHWIEAWRACWGSFAQLPFYLFLHFSSFFAWMADYLDTKHWLYDEVSGEAGLRPWRIWPILFWYTHTCMVEWNPSSITHFPMLRENLGWLSRNRRDSWRITTKSDVLTSQGLPLFSVSTSVCLPVLALALLRTIPVLRHLLPGFVWKTL